MQELEKFRKEIDEIDREILTQLAKRFEVVKKVWEYKKLHNMPPLQKKRWEEVLKSRRDFAKKLELWEDFIEKIWNEIHKYAIDLEK